jgi:hypothetical protein
MLSALIGIALLGPVASDSPFNVYAVYAAPAAMRAVCDPAQPPHLGDFTHRFRGPNYPRGPLTIRAGVHREINALGEVEWETAIARQEAIRLEGAPALVVLVFSNHVGGSGSATHLLVVRCRQRRWQVIFEAGGAIYPAPGRGYRFSADDLRVTHAVWLPDDAHAWPSRAVDEVYRWHAGRGRFVLVRRTDRPWP